ncbi:hypothetical protein LTR95_004834 [Oleoguttula sp. CCFEE 5521]
MSHLATRLFNRAVDLSAWPVKDIVFVSIVGSVMLAALVEWLLWLLAFMYCLMKVYQKAEGKGKWAIRTLALANMTFFMVMRLIFLPIMVVTLPMPGEVVKQFPEDWVAGLQWLVTHNVGRSRRMEYVLDEQTAPKMVIVMPCYHEPPEILLRTVDSIVDSEYPPSNLGNLYKNQGKLKEAEEMYVRALRGKEEAWGAKHTSTLGTINNLGNLYKNQGKLKEAEEMYVRSLRGYEEAWGAKHTSTLDTVNNLGALYADQGKLNEAEEMYVRALRGYEEALGAKHTSTLNTLYNLGNLYRDRGEVGKAKETYERAAERYEDAEGDHEHDIVHVRKQLSLLTASAVNANDDCQSNSDCFSYRTTTADERSLW